MFPEEPSGVEGGRSIIDMGNMPVMITPNEYRDGIIPVSYTHLSKKNRSGSYESASIIIYDNAI